MTYEAACACLLALPRYAKYGAAAYRPGFARIEALLAAMEHPHRAFESVHVAGTNGKGSTASMVAAAASAAGRRVGLHTSPHLFRLNERMRLDGVPAPDAWLAAAVARYQPVFEAVAPSFFEAMVALSFRYFAERGVDLAVVEVGLGGRLDATNVLQPCLTLVTAIGYDHMDLLGETLPAIAREKAGIIKPGVPVLVADNPPEVVDVFRAVARKQGAPLHLMAEEVALDRVETALDGITLDARTPLRRYDALHVGLAGAHQATNAALALRAAELLLKAPPEALYAGLHEVRQRAGLRGRLDVLGTAPLVMADVGHNADGVAAALAFARSQAPRGRCFVLLGMMKDKVRPPVVAALAGTTVFALELEPPRACPAADLAALLQEGGISVGGTGSPARGLCWFYERAGSEDLLLITGSHLALAGLAHQADGTMRAAPASESFTGNAAI